MPMPILEPDLARSLQNLHCFPLDPGCLSTIPQAGVLTSFKSSLKSHLVGEVSLPPILKTVLHSHPLSCFSVRNMTLTIESKHRVSGLLMTRCESRGGRVSLFLPLLSPWHSEQCLVIVVAKKQTKLYGRQTYKHR